MSERLAVTKTYKLYINGQFVRSESGRSMEVRDRAGGAIAHLCRASRKDLRQAVEAARKAQPGWAKRTAYNRGQILYRMAEMLEGKAGELVEALSATLPEGPDQAQREVRTAIDRLVVFAGWTDKFAQVLGGNNPVAGPFYNFTIPEPTGVVGVIAPDEQPLLALISLIAPPLSAGNTIVALGSSAHPLATSLLGEVLATSDVPAGVVNLLTGRADEIAPHMAQHRDISAIHAANQSEELARTLRAGSADNVKRVTVRNLDNQQWYDDTECGNPWWIEPFVEMKTIWHPARI